MSHISIDEGVILKNSVKISFPGGPQAEKQGRKKEVDDDEDNCQRVLMPPSLEII